MPLISSEDLIPDVKVVIACPGILCECATDHKPDEEVTNREP